MPNPKVSVLVPVLDEEASIEACLASLSAQDYPGDAEIVVVDGGSGDATRHLVEAWKSSHPGLVLIENPGRVQSHGLNLAAAAATGEILIRADAHTTYSPEYLRLSVESLSETGANAVGGVQNPVGRGVFGRAVAAAMRIPFGSGPALFRHATGASEVDTVYLGAFTRADFERLGGFRTLPSGVAEDADLYFRWRRQGARVVVDPAIVTTYTPRSSPGGLWRQYWRYGLGKADMLYVNGRWPSWRPAAPLALTVGLATTTVLALTGSWLPLAALAALWQGALLVATKSRPLVMVAASVMHLAYGLGLARGLFRWPQSVRRQVE